MHIKDDKPRITAYADNEIKDLAQREELFNLLSKDISLKVDYDIQVLIKDLVKEKIEFQQTPLRLKQRIIKQMKASL